jgi:hypothetical protein
MGFAGLDHISYKDLINHCNIRRAFRSPSLTSFGLRSKRNVQEYDSLMQIKKQSGLQNGASLVE